MIRFFKTIQPAALFTIPLVAMVLWLPAFFGSNSQAGSFESQIINWAAMLPQFIQKLLSVSLVTISAIYLNHVVNKHEVLYRHSYVTAFFYVLLMGFHRDVLVFHPILVSNLIIIRALDRTFSLFKSESPASPIFDSTFLIALSSLIYSPSVILFLVFLYALINLRSFNFREFLIALIGFLLPFYFLLVYAFWTDSLSASLQNFLSKFSLHKISPDIEATLVLWIFTGYFLLLISFAMLRLRLNFSKNSIKTRSTQEILFVFFILSAGGIFFIPKISLYHFTQFAIPFAVFLGYYFLSAKRKLWVYEVSAWVLIGLIISSYF